MPMESNAGPFIANLLFFSYEDKQIGKAKLTELIQGRKRRIMFRFIDNLAAINGACWKTIP